MFNLDVLIFIITAQSVETECILLNSNLSPVFSQVSKQRNKSKTKKTSCVPTFRVSRLEVRRQKCAEKGSSSAILPSSSPSFLFKRSWELRVKKQQVAA